MGKCKGTSSRDSSSKDGKDSEAFETWDLPQGMGETMPNGNEAPDDGIPQEQGSQAREVAVTPCVAVL